MRTADIVRAWGRILKGSQPSLSIEITRECPLRCPGCYAYEPEHVGGGTGLRDLADFKGDTLIRGVLNLVDRLKPLHLSIVGGDPLVRYREVAALVPLLVERGVHVQIVTSAFRPLPASFAGQKHLSVVVSIDGLQPDHDVRRAPATYARIGENIAGHRVVVHCTVTGQMMKRPGYLGEFLKVWTPKAEVEKVWFSLFTPQVGTDMAEILSRQEREAAVRDMLELRQRFPKLDMAPSLIRQFTKPPGSPESCIFAQTTRTVSADLTTQIVPCQLGGNPDCGACGCVAAMGLAAVGEHRLGGLVPVGAIFKASLAIGQSLFQERAKPTDTEPLRILQ